MTEIAPDVLSALVPVVNAFEHLGVPYYIGGSVASSIYGIASATLDVDLDVHLQLNQVTQLVEMLQTVYYIDALVVSDAVRRKASFNLIHLPTLLKVDVFIPREGPLDQSALHRVRFESLEESNDPGTEARNFSVVSPEDVVIRKLEWYKEGGEVSERQWLDIVGVLKVQAASLDRDYLQRWATYLELTDLLGRAMEDAGI